MKNNKPFHFDELHKLAVSKGWYLNMATSNQGLIYWLDWKNANGDWNQEQFLSLTKLSKFIKEVV